MREIWTFRRDRPYFEGNHSFWVKSKMSQAFNQLINEAIAWLEMGFFGWNSHFDRISNLLAEIPILDSNRFFVWKWKIDVFVFFFFFSRIGHFLLEFLFLKVELLLFVKFHLFLIFLFLTFLFFYWNLNFFEIYFFFKSTLLEGIKFKFRFYLLQLKCLVKLCFHCQKFEFAQTLQVFSQIFAKLFILAYFNIFLF